MLEKIEEYAHSNNIPIMEKEGIEFLTEYIKKNNIKSILEIGCAIGYSSICFCNVDKDIKVTTIERDEKRYKMAKENVKSFSLENRIDIIFDDAFNVELSNKYDLIFIDAAKGKNKDFFTKFEKNLNSNGYIITDNMSFHGYVHKDENEIESKNIRALVRKIKDYINFLDNNIRYKTRIYDIGDGIAVSEKRL